MSKGDRTKEHIIERAAVLFNQRGYEGGSMAELMEATGLEKGGIYRHFDSKEEIAAAAFDHAWRTIFALRTTDLESIPNRVDRLKKLIGNFVERPSPLPGGCPLLNTAVDSDDGNALLRERARKALETFRGLVAKTVTEGVRRREVRAGVNAKHLATLIVSSLEGAVMVARLDRDRKPLRTVRSYLDDYLETRVRRR